MQLFAASFLVSVALLSIDLRVAFGHELDVVPDVQSFGNSEDKQRDNACGGPEQGADGTTTTVGILRIIGHSGFTTRDYGCIVIQAKANGGPPFPVVNNNATKSSQCAQFKITSDRTGVIFRFQDIKSRKYMSHSPGSDGIDFQNDPSGVSQDSNFTIAHTGLFGGNFDSYSLKPVNADNDVCFSPNLNVKNRGPKLFIAQDSLKDHRDLDLSGTDPAGTTDPVHGDDGTTTTTGILKVNREDVTGNFGCIVIRRADGNGGPPFPAVDGKAKKSTQCAQFKIISDKTGNIFRFQDIKSGKYMSHSPGSDWIYLQDDSTGMSTETGFKTVLDDVATQLGYSIMPANYHSYVYADYDEGDINVKGRGFQVFIAKDTLQSHLDI